MCIMNILLRTCLNRLDQFKRRNLTASIIFVSPDLITEFKENISKLTIIAKTNDTRAALSRTSQDVYQFQLIAQFVDTVNLHLINSVIYCTEIFIIRRSKVSSKIEIIENLLDKVDNLIIAGGMTYTFTKAMGGKIGISICEDDKLDLALDLMKKAKDKGVNLVLAVDAKIADAFSNDANTKFCAVDEIPDGWEGLDIGPKTEELFAEVIKNSKTILWNGPTGVFEFENFTHGSRAVGEAIVEATKNGAFSLVGGGDSVACVNKFGLANGVSYVSTGGGALLEAIEGKILPGIAAINE